jgi:preprotein translocase subunit SecA
MFRLHSIFAYQPERKVAQRHGTALQQVRQSAASLRSESDQRLCERAEALRGEACAGGGTQVTVEALALISESVRRVHGLVAHDCQLLAGLSLSEGRLVEMATGEGKTLVALLPAFRFALHGLGAHVATVNPYLAERDFEFARPTFERLGLTIGLLPEKQDPAKKRAAYACDVTYGVGTEFGFDYLRDQLAVRATGSTEPRFHEVLLGTSRSKVDLAQRGHAFAVIDEADSVLIDEARSPLIVSAGGKLPHAHPEVYWLADAIASQLEQGADFRRDPETQRFNLTPAGNQRALAQLSDEVLAHLERLWPHYLESALQARHQFRRDVHYVVEDGKAVIVDEFTGRLCPDRSWRGGLHQAVEAVAGVEITSENASEATITRPAYFRLYGRACGMTGTALEASSELHDCYALKTEVIPPHRPCRRSLLPDRVFVNRETKLAAVAREVAARHRTGQPVLVGTRTIENSEALAAVLAPLGLPVRLLNAKQDEEEAHIVEQAGEPGAITIATNMAGRGAHIPVCAESVRLGGLHVIGVERHESARVDRQLVGRAARQGQPGSAQFFVSIDDDLLLRHTPGLAARLAKKTPDQNGELPGKTAVYFRRVQAKVERADREQRRQLARYDEWLNELKNAL